MSDSEPRMIEILRILNEQENPTGSKLIAEELKNRGFNLGERAVRYHMQILDEKGYTEKMGYSGRKITELGKDVLEKGLIYNQVDFAFSKFEEMIYLCDFDYLSKKGKVVVNTSNIYEKKAYEVIKKVFDAGICVSPYVNTKKSSRSNSYQMKTICGTTIDGILLNNGIPSIPLYGGLLEIEDNIPTKFSELISYKKTSIAPLDAFIDKDMTSVLSILETGTGSIPANFRVIPSDARDKTINIINKLKNIGINGILDIGESGENILGIPVTEGMTGLAIAGGITPFCAAKEMDYNVDIKIGEDFEEFENMKPITKNKNSILKAPTNHTSSKIPFLLSKSWNLIEKTDFNIENKEGSIITNVSYVDKKDIDKSLDLMKNVYKKSPEHINPFYKIIESENDDKIGIATICSLSIDGILINNGLICRPKYGGLLELGDSPLFIELISYSGSSIDPHKIFISKNMTSIFNEYTHPSRILASVKEIPFIAKDESEKLLDELKKIGFSIYKIGKPRELIYNSKINNYNFGIVAGSGLNTIASLKEANINVEVKAIEKIMSFEDMDHL
ncbi:NrpR regulatory domain-containing protein [Methanobrevibacter sp. OttesenSCG-928-K11]|nr:NrpR regulatory domain-containing protein [Methanobrevibacter sp. OttesenSCG-928-K11]MDL2270647.1 NrpR regulatory domain-containing protein [Methanobrevibacter sp. OttesenSCG-928-I08]